MKLVVVLLQAVASKALSGFVYTGFGRGACPSAAEVERDLERMHRHTDRIRIYGDECGQISHALAAIARRKLSMKVLVGLWTRDGRLEESSDKLVRLLQRKPAYRNHILGITVGNEDVFNGTPSGVVAANIIRIRGKLLASGLEFPVSTAEVGHLWSQDLIDASDAIHANLYTFFGKGNNDMAAAAKGVVRQADALRRKTAKPVVISETGWPAGGSYPYDHFGTPSPANQRLFLEKLTCLSRGYRFFVLEAFDSPAKGDPGSIERQFGLLDASGNFREGFAPKCTK